MTKHVLRYCRFYAGANPRTPARHIVHRGMHDEPHRPIKRTQFLSLCLAAAAVSALPAIARADEAPSPAGDTVRTFFGALEHGAGGVVAPGPYERLGVYAVDAGSGHIVAYRANERFPMCSTWKLLMAAMLLQHVDRNTEHLERIVPVTAADIVPNSTVLHSRTALRPLTLWELAAIMIERSDNTASNILLRELGGPGALTAFVRATGDAVTRLDRNEPDLNSAIPQDPRDTTTPEAMAQTMRTLLLGDVLSFRSRLQLESWLAGNRTGDARIRAGMPPKIDVGDKTGTGENGATNDVAIIRPPDRAPIFLTLYYTGALCTPKQRDAVLASAARHAYAALIAQPPAQNR